MNWLTVKLLGKELVSKEELAELKDYGKLPLGDEVGLVERSFILGRTSALSKKSEYKDLTLKRLSKLQKRKFSSVEQLAIREAKLHTAHRLQAIADGITAGASARVSQATQELLSDATVKEIIEDELALALAEKKTRQQLATSIGNKIGTDLSSSFKKLMVTEMHRAKTRGIAMAIANKVDIYSSSGGPESSVSVVPNRDACKDCHNLYLTDTGNPRIFKLKDLVAQGANSDEGVSHTRTRGYHMGWKPVMPPAHPHCFCELVYVPPGMGWEDGKLKVTDEFRYKDHISKAVDKGSMSATVKPPGPKSTQGPDAPKTPSIAGLPAPGNVPGPGRPAGSNAATIPAPAGTTAVGGKEMEGCPFGGGKDCIKNGGNGASQHERGGTIMREHQEALAKQGLQEEAEQLQVTPDEHLADMHAIESYTHDDKAATKTLDHIQNGTIVSTKDIGEVKSAKKGVTIGTKKVGIKGNGSACTKPEAPGMEGQDVQNEVTAYKSFSLFGSSLCPPTGSRMMDGQLNSSQAWCDDHSPAAVVTRSINSSELIESLKDKSPNWEKVRGQLEEMTVMDIVICNTDRHLENFLLNDEMDDVRAIDHGYSFGKGLQGLRPEVFEGFNSKHMHLRLNETLNERFSNTTFGDMKRAYGDDTLEWKTAQSYMRMKYIQQVATDNHGRLPLEEFTGASGSLRLSPNEKFEKFVHDFIDSNVDDPSSPEFDTANHFANAGILMPADTTHSNEELRRRGDHIKYEMESRRFIAEKEQIQSGEKSFMADARKVYEKEKDELHAAFYKQEEPITKEIVDVNMRAAAAQEDYYKFDGLVDQALAEGNIGVVPDLQDARLRAKKEYHKEKATRAEIEQRQADLYDQLVEDVDAAKDRAFGKLVPPGQEKAFARLNAQLENIGKSPRDRKTFTKPVADTPAQSAAAGIERRKRDLAGLGWGNRKKARG